MKNQMEYPLELQRDNLGIIVAQHYYGIPLQGRLSDTTTPPYDEARDRWTLQPRDAASSIVELKRSEKVAPPRRGFWLKLFGQKA